MTVSQSTNTNNDLANETVRRLVWRMLQDAAVADADAVLQAVEAVPVDALALLTPAPALIYALMAEAAEAGGRPDPVSLLAAAQAGGHLSGANGDGVHRVLLALASSTGEALRLPQSTRAVAALVLRAKAETLGLALAEEADTAPEDALVERICTRAAELLDVADRLEKLGPARPERLSAVADREAA